MQKRGQAATEFLTTYGWAILILIIVIGLIVALNIFKPVVPNNCIASDPISCQDVEFTTPNNINLVLTASGVSTVIPGEETKVIELRMNNPLASNCTNIEPSDDVGPPPEFYPYLLDNIQTVVYCEPTSWSIPINLKKGNKFSGFATVYYRLPGSTSVYTSKIHFSGTAEES